MEFIRIKYYEFCDAFPEGWFELFEEVLARNQITHNLDKYTNLLCNLTREKGLQIGHVLHLFLPNEEYNELKSLLLVTATRNSSWCHCPVHATKPTNNNNIMDTPNPELVNQPVLQPTTSSTDDNQTNDDILGNIKENLPVEATKELAAETENIISTTVSNPGITSSADDNQTKNSISNNIENLLDEAIRELAAATQEIKEQQTEDTIPTTDNNLETTTTDLPDDFSPTTNASPEIKLDKRKKKNKTKKSKIKQPKNKPKSRKIKIKRSSKLQLKTDKTRKNRLKKNKKSKTSKTKKKINQDMTKLNKKNNNHLEHAKIKEIMILHLQKIMNPQLRKLKLKNFKKRKKKVTNIKANKDSRITLTANVLVCKNKLKILKKLNLVSVSDTHLLKMYICK